MRRRAGAAGLAAACALTAALAPLSPAMVERYFSTGLYPHLQHTVTSASNLVPFAWLDVLIVAAGVTMVSAMWRAVGATRRHRHWTPFLRLALNGVIAAAALYVAFLVVWGLNYRRVPMQDRLELGVAPSTLQLRQLADQAAAELNRLRAQPLEPQWQGEQLRDASLRGAFEEVQALLAPAPPAVPGRLKHSLLGPYFRWTGVDGMVNPFGLEVLANPDLLPFERPFVAAHEWAHLAGFASESEANFVGWLTCLHADPGAQYSGWLYLYWQIDAVLPDEARRAVAQSLSPAVRSDVTAIVERLRRGEFPLLQRASWRVYDRYLKANRVDAGVRSYGEVVTLILRASFDERWTPQRRRPL